MNAMRVFNAINNRPRVSKFKMDNLFFNAIGKARSVYNRKIGCHLGKMILLIVFHIIDTLVLGSTNTKILTFMKIAIFVCLFNAGIKYLIQKIGYADKESNNSFFTYLADQVGHATREELSPGELNSLKLCVSSHVYNQSNGTTIGDQAATPEIREKYEKINSNLVINEVLQRWKMLPLIDLVGRILSFIIVIYGIVTLFVSGPSSIELIVLGIYLLLESLNIWVVILVILGIIFFPVICCVGCVYLCCCGKGLIDQNTLSIPEPAKATAQKIEQTDGECTICLQNLNLNEKIITMPCNIKHTFHEKCIMSWLRVSNSCPICRAPLPAAI